MAQNESLRDTNVMCVFSTRVTESCVPIVFQRRFIGETGVCAWFVGLASRAPMRGVRASNETLQHDTHLWLFFDPSFSRSATVAGKGDTRCTGPFAMSAVV
jgi:hypothetical protein